SLAALLVGVLIRVLIIRSGRSSGCHVDVDTEELRERVGGEDDVFTDQHVVGVELVDRDQVYLGHVAQREPVDLVLATEHDEHLARRGRRSQGGYGGLRLRRFTVHEGRYDVDVAASGAVGQRATQRGRLHLLRRPLAVVPRDRTVRDATTGELWCPDR